MKKKLLTGIKPTGVPHLGNYLGAIRPALSLSKDYDTFLMIADLHALTAQPKPETLKHDTYAVAAAWLAYGADPDQITFFKQSEVKEIPTLAWILSCVLPFGLLNRGHSVKDARNKFKERGESEDDLLHGVFAYPVLMAADILAFDIDIVPVGKDQKQHLEIAQEAARKVNNLYGENSLLVPDIYLDPKVMTIPGIDGQKMSKSYNNTLVPLDSEVELKKKILAIKTDSTPYGDPLDPENDNIFKLFELLAPREKTDLLRAQYKSGRKDPSMESDDKSNFFGFGDAKRALLEQIINEFKEPRERYQKLMSEPELIDTILKEGSKKARQVAQNVLFRVMSNAGLNPKS